MTDRPSQHPRGFTLIEVLVVMGIIVVLAGLLFPVVSRVRKAARDTDCSAQLASMSGAIQAYYGVYSAYPGPVPDSSLFPADSGIGFVTSPAPAGYDNTSWQRARITGSENLVLGLMGGLRNSSTGDLIRYEPAAVGQGPISLNTANPKKAAPFIENLPLSWRITPGLLKTGQFAEETGATAAEWNYANDTHIPEIVDRYADPLPVLYLRARVGSAGIIASAGSQQYDLNHVIAYTGAYTGTYPALTIDSATPTAAASKSIGLSKSAPSYFVNSGTAIGTPAKPYHGLRTVTPAAVLSPPGTGYYYPYDAYPYFNNPAQPGSPRQKDGYVLISAGHDRIYGTKDDITSFGSINP